MENEQQFSALIYEYFLIRFQFGYYKQGDTLPTIETLCQKFSVAEHTVKVALRQLRIEGYIDMRGGRATKVLFRQTYQELQDFITGYFSKRWDTYSDLYSSAELIFIPMLLEGLQRMSEKELTTLSYLANQIEEDTILHFYCQVLQKINNPLLMNLFWETLFFFGFPFVGRKRRPTQYSTETVQKRLKKLTDCAKKHDWDSVHDALLKFQQNDYLNIAKYLEQHVPHLPREKQIPFIWRIYHDHPQIRYNLSVRILHEIYIGTYRDKHYLPSYAKLAEKYNVSISTVRRTIETLYHLGAVQPINGKGTRICPIGEPCNPPNFANYTIRRNLSFYIQAFDLARYTCENVTRNFILVLPSEIRKELISQLETELYSAHCVVSIFHFLNYIIEYSALQGVKSVYRIIYSLFLWGCPLKEISGENSELDQASELFTKMMIQYLDKNDADGCAATIKKLIDTQFIVVEHFLLQQGIGLEELRLSPSIRFLVTEN